MRRARRVGSRRVIPLRSRDLLSAAAASSSTSLTISTPPRRAARRAACCQRLPIFDGRQRFDIAMSFKRMERVQAEKGYDGPALVCTALYEPIAGHRPERYAIQYLRATRDIEVWFVPIAGTRMLVPYR